MALHRLQRDVAAERGAHPRVQHVAACAAIGYLMSGVWSGRCLEGRRERDG
jgi:hypothetical protein